MNPTLMVLGGFDSTAEELLPWIGDACATRGWNALIFEGPGQRGAMNMNPGLVFRPDDEVPVSAVIDYALSRPDVDARKLAMIGYSFGGYTAPRAAAREPRVRAVIANPLCIDIPRAIRMALPSVLWKLPEPLADRAFTTLARLSMTARFFLENGKAAFGVNTPAQFLRAWEPYTLWSVQDKLTVPLLILLGEDELADATKPLLKDTFEFVRDLKAPVTAHVFSRAQGGAAHCQIDSPERLPPAVFPWLDRLFCARPGSATPPAGDSFSDVIAMIREHHGADFAATLAR